MSSDRRTWLGFAIVATLSIVLVQWLTADLTFVSDDWLILSRRSLDLPSLLAPFNQHLSILPIAILLVLRDTIGLGAHAAFLLAAQVAHVVVAAGVFAIALRHRSRRVALGIGTLALVPGPGAANLMWAFQVGAVISTAAGVWALTLLDGHRRGAWVVAALCGLALVSSSFGLPYVVAVVLFAALKRDRGTTLAVATIGVAWGAWYLAFDANGGGLCAAPSIGPLVLASGGFTIAGLAYAVGAPMGIGLGAQPLVWAAAGAGAAWVAWILVAIRSGARPWLATSAIGGIVAMSLLLAATRECLGLQAAGASRYVYVTGMLVLVGLAATPAPPVLHSPDKRWVFPVGAVALAILVGLNLRAAILIHDEYLDVSTTVRAAVDVAFSPDGLTCHTSPVRTDQLTSDIAYLPPPAWLRDWLGNPRILDPPGWVDSAWQPSSTLLAEVRRIMCDTPHGPDA